MTDHGLEVVAPPAGLLSTAKMLVRHYDKDRSLHSHSVLSGLIENLRTAVGSEMEGDGQSDLINVEPLRAVEIKYQRGREKYGPKWVGPRPIICAHDEVLDCLAYVLYERDSDDIGNIHIDELTKRLLDLLQGVRTAIAMVENK